MNKTTPTGIAFVDCEKRGHKHPANRTHCEWCGKCTIFGHDFCGPDHGE